MKKQVIISKVVLSVLFFICLIDMPYGYYQFVRFIAMIGFAFFAYNEYESSNKNWMLFYIISAILINPFFKISLGRELWNVIDVIWAIILIITVFIDRQKSD